MDILLKYDLGYDTEMRIYRDDLGWKVLTIYDTEGDGADIWETEAVPIRENAPDALLDDLSEIGKKISKSIHDKDFDELISAGCLFHTMLSILAVGSDAMKLYDMQHKMASKPIEWGKWGSTNGKQN